MCCIVEEEQGRRDKELEKPDKAKYDGQILAGEGKLSAIAIGHHHHFDAITFNAVVVKGNVWGSRYHHIFEKRQQVKSTLAN